MAKVKWAKIGMMFIDLVKQYKSRQALWLHLFEYREGKLYWLNPRAPCVKIGDLAGSLNTRYYSVFVAGKTYYLHKIIYEMFNGDCEVEVDHKDRNSLNNLKDNLRAATRLENTRNVGARKDNALGLKGVSYHKATNKYAAQSTENGKRKWLGSYDTPEEASAAYQAYIIKNHGEFANCN
jgi:hypothetical protein